jgi:hypothetical protein
MIKKGSVAWKGLTYDPETSITTEGGSSEGITAREFPHTSE